MVASRSTISCAVAMTSRARPSRGPAAAPAAAAGTAVRLVTGRAWDIRDLLLGWARSFPRRTGGAAGVCGHLARYERGPWEGVTRWWTRGVESSVAARGTTVRRAGVVAGRETPRPAAASITSSSAPSASSVRTSADAAPAPDSGTTVGSLRQSYIGFLNAFRDPADQTPASPSPNPPAAAGRVGPAAASGPATVAAAPPPDAQAFRPVPPGYYTPSAPPYKPADQPSAAAPPGAATASAASTPSTNPPPAAADRPYALKSFLNIFR